MVPSNLASGVLKVRRSCSRGCLRARVAIITSTPPPLSANLTLSADGGFYSGAFARGQPAAGPGVFSFANGNKQSGKWIEQKEEGAEDDALPKLVWISDADASI